MAEEQTQMGPVNQAHRSNNHDQEISAGPVNQAHRSNNHDQESSAGPVNQAHRSNNHDQDISAETNDEYTKEVAHLRLSMRLFFFNPIKLTCNSVSVHFGYCGVFLLQIVKLSLITAMLLTFGNERNDFTDIVNRGHFTLRNLMMKNWNAGWETVPYPPAHGDFAVYTKEDIIDRINYAVAMYYNVEKEAIGEFSRPENASVITTLKYFDDLGLYNRSTDSLSIKELIFTTDTGLKLDRASGIYTYDVATEFESQNLSHPIKRLLHLSLDFTLNSIRVFHEEMSALCLDISGKLTFSDLDHNGQVIEDLDTTTKEVKCATISVNAKDWNFHGESLVKLVTSVITVCVCSFLVTIYNFRRACVLLRRTKRFMKNHYGTFYKPMNKNEKDLPWTEYFQLFKLWDFFSVFADILLLVTCGEKVSVLKELKFDTSILDSFTVWLGVGCILSWLSILRYMKFTNKFHLLFSTMYRAAWDLFAYLLCVGVLFMGFSLCGYGVLGPYHSKTLQAATETLLSMLNGDDIFATLAILDVSGRKNPTILWFAHVYIWIYVIIFTIVVLNLIVAILNSGYEVIKKKHEKKDDARDLGPLEVALQDFILNVTQSEFRQPLEDFIRNTDHVSTEESLLRTELQSLLRISEDTGDIVPVLPRTIKTFMNHGAANEGRGGCSKIMTFKLCCTETD